MKNQQHSLPTDIIAVGPIAPALALELGFRHKRLFAIVFIVVLGITILVERNFPSYQSEMQLLVKRERLEPIVTASEGNAMQISREAISEEELNSEIEILRSNDILTRVVRENKLDRSVYPLFTKLMLSSSVDQSAIKRAKAAERLSGQLDVGVAKKSNIILVRYSANSADTAKSVLDTLARAYIDKHTAINRAPRQFEFFDEQTRLCKKLLEQAQDELSEFNRSAGITSALAERDMSVQRGGELRATLQNTQAAIAEAEHRAALLEQQINSASPRLVTQERQADNPQLMQQMKGTLLSLQLKRLELLQKYEPNYPLVVEVESQIKEATAAIAAAEAAPLKDRTTDVDPTYEWLRSELTKTRTAIAGLNAKASELRRTQYTIQSRSSDLGEHAIKQQQLIKRVELAQQNYDLYLRKREEARINDALDQSQILNVVVAEQPTTPVLPVRSPSWILALGSVLAVVFGTIAVIGADHMDGSFRSAEDVDRVLEAPLLAVLPSAEEQDNKEE